MDFNNAITRLEKFSMVINKAVIGMALLEALFVLFIGVASSYLDTDNTTVNRFSLLSLFIFGILYLLLLLIKTLYNANYPGSITAELKSERELSILKIISDKQKTINDFLIITMQRLNGQTCALNYGDDIHLCDQDIQAGILDLIEPLVENLHFVLNTTLTDFTIGIYLEGYRSMENFDEWESGIIIIKDKLGKSEQLEKDLLNQTDAKGENLQIQTAIRQSLNDQKFVISNYAFDEEYTIICSPMPFACDEDDANGVLFVLSKQLNAVPSETELNLKIFNRVIANWVYRYNECVLGRQGRIKEENERNKAAADGGQPLT